ncbi:hypothetical protein JCM10207_004843 [Rhodosporidiobolus poonsookiae]
MVGLGTKSKPSTDTAKYAATKNLVPADGGYYLALERFALGFPDVGFAQLVKAQERYEAATPKAKRRASRMRKDSPPVSAAACRRLQTLAKHVAKGRQALKDQDWQTALDELTAAGKVLDAAKEAEDFSPSANTGWWIASWTREALEGLQKPQDLAFCSDLLERTPQDKSLSYIRAFALFQFGKLDEAKASAELAAEDSEKLTKLVNTLKSVQAAQEAARTAPAVTDPLEAFTAWFTHSANNRHLQALGLYERARAYMAREQYDKVSLDCLACIALHDLDRHAGSASTFTKQVLQAWLLRAQALVQLGELEVALKLLKDAQDGTRWTKEECEALAQSIVEAYRKKEGKEGNGADGKGDKDYYAILGIERTAPVHKITALYRRLALIYHPDKGGNESKFKEINGAYEAIKAEKEKGV